MILSWYENMREEDIPPEWMWPISDEINAHFKRLKAKQDSGATDDEDDGMMLQNEYARNRGANAR